MQALNDFAAQLSGFLWGLPAIILLVGTGLYLTLKLNFIQFRGFKEAIKITSGKYHNKKNEGINHPFKALAATLSATIGTGNIAGVATAVALGGPGALFWMWVTAIVGMATKYATCTLSIKYRQKLPNGDITGGPMYVLKNGLNMKWLAICYAFFTAVASFGIGSSVQSNSIVSGLQFAFPKLLDHSQLYIGIILAIAVGLVIIGGVKRIANVAAVIVPFMMLIYIVAALTVIIVNFTLIPSAFYDIFTMAFTGSSIAGGGIGAAIRFGVARGVFSNEAGLGTAGIMHATAVTDNPVRQGLVAMLGPFIDTIVICTMTGLVIVITGVWSPELSAGNEGAAMTAYAFTSGLSVFGIDNFGSRIIGISLFFFAYSTIVSWSYYGNVSVEFLWGKSAILPYKIIFILMVIVGAVFPIQLVWNIADIMNILMALPNLIALVLMAGFLRKKSKENNKIIIGK
ncbi:sodium:alanine symporter family protein [Francisellaceae bacterium]|nr:sodium:alanine symporter family protein [Francisellaceae bacterium]